MRSFITHFFGTLFRFVLRVVAVYVSNILQSLTYGNWRVFPSTAQAEWWKIHAHATMDTLFAVVLYLLPAYLIAKVLRSLESDKYHFAVDTVFATICILAYPIRLFLFIINCEGYSAAWGEGEYIDNCQITAFGAKYYSLAFMQLIWQTILYLMVILTCLRVLRKVTVVFNATHR